MIRPAILAVALAFAPAVPVHAGSLEDALRLVPADAAAAFVVPSVKAASDDLQLAIDRMGRAEAALGGRPIDLLKAQLRIGAGFDDRGAFATWSVRSGESFAMVGAVPVVDADAFVKATFVDAPEAGAGAMRMPGRDDALWVRKAGKHVLVASAAAPLDGWEPKDGFAAALEARVGRRGMEIVRTADAFAWASAPVMKRWAAAARAEASLDGQIASMVPAGGAEAAAGEQLAQVGKARERGAQVLEQLEDGVVAVDFDALAVGVRAWARFADGSEFAKAIPAARVQPRDVATLLGRLPAAAPYVAVGADLRAMGGLAHLRTVLATMPQGDRLRLPEWFDRVQDKVDEVQLAAYPSRLALVTGGLLNDASLVVVTQDPPAVKAALRAWVEEQAGERGGLRTEATWEEARELKDGTKVSAFALKETVTGPGPDAMERMAKQLLVSARGMHGFAREVPGALVVTYSQRADVLDRASKAAGGDGKTLGAASIVRAMAPWLVPDADVVAFLGVGELLGAAQQVAAVIPGGAAEMVPEAPEGLEPVAFAVRSKASTWEAALVLPSGVLGIAFDAAMAQAMGGAPRRGGDADGGRAPGPAIAPTPAPATVPTPAPSPAPAP